MNILKSILLIVFSSCCCCHNREVTRHVSHDNNALDSKGWGYFSDTTKVSPKTTLDFMPFDLDTTYWRHITDSIENQIWIEEHVKSI